MSYSRLDSRQDPDRQLRRGTQLDPVDDVRDAFESGDSDSETEDDRHIMLRSANGAYEPVHDAGGARFDPEELANPATDYSSTPPQSHLAPGQQSQENEPSTSTRRARFRDLFNTFSSGPTSASFVNNNDGVFANLTAKPDGEKPNDDRPPTYEEAAADATPPYWETTIMSPGSGDEMLLDGLPVGSPINFIWNMMVSAAFQFVGFFLTYLLHTSHAAKQGSRAGLGFTLLQCGYYLRLDNQSPEPTTLPPEFEPTDPNDVDVSTSGTVVGTFSQGHPTSDTTVDSSAGTTNWISLALIILGIIIVVKALSDYFLVKRTQAALMRSSSDVVISDEEVETNITDIFPGAFVNRVGAEGEQQQQGGGSSDAAERPAISPGAVPEAPPAATRPLTAEQLV